MEEEQEDEETWTGSGGVFWEWQIGEVRSDWHKRWSEEIYDNGPLISEASFDIKQGGSQADRIQTKPLAQWRFDIHLAQSAAELLCVYKVSICCGISDSVVRPGWTNSIDVTGKKCISLSLMRRSVVFFPIWRKTA